MASEEVPEVNLVGNTSDMEYYEDPVVDDETADGQETTEREEAAEDEDAADDRSEERRVGKECRL